MPALSWTCSFLWSKRPVPQAGTSPLLLTLYTLFFLLTVLHFFLFLRLFCADNLQLPVHCSFPDLIPPSLKGISDVLTAVSPWLASHFLKLNFYSPHPNSLLSINYAVSAIPHMILSLILLFLSPKSSQLLNLVAFTFVIPACLASFHFWWNWQYNPMPPGMLFWML